MSVAYRDEICAELAKLPEGNLRALLRVLRASSPERPMRRWSSAVGTLSDEDAEQMRRVIEDGCEVIEPNEW